MSDCNSRGIVGSVAPKASNVVYGVDIGVADAYVINPCPPVCKYEDGQIFTVLITNTNTGASTLDVSGLGPLPIIKEVSNQMEAMDLPAGKSIELIVRDGGTNLQILNGLHQEIDLHLVEKTAFNGSISGIESITGGDMNGLIIPDAGLVSFTTLAGSGQIAIMNQATGKMNKPIPVNWPTQVTFTSDAFADTGVIISFSDSAANPGVDTTVESISHGLLVGDVGKISNTTNYNGSFIVQAVR